MRSSRAPRSTPSGRPWPRRSPTDVGTAITAHGTRPASTLKSAPSMPATAMTTRWRRISSSRSMSRHKPATPTSASERRLLAGERERPRGFARDGKIRRAAADDRDPADPRAARAARRGLPCAWLRRSRARLGQPPTSRRTCAGRGASAAVAGRARSACATIASICAADFGSHSTASLVPVRSARSQSRRNSSIGGLAQERRAAHVAAHAREHAALRPARFGADARERPRRPRVVRRRELDHDARCGSPGSAAPLRARGARQAASRRHR